MPLKPEDVVKALDLDLSKYDKEEEPVKVFSADFGKEWKRAKDVEDVNAAKGLWNNVLRGKLRKLSKENELDLEVKDDKEVDPVDYLPELAKKLTGKSAAQIADLSEKLKSNAPEKVVKEWEEKYGKLEQKFKDQDGLLTGLKGQYEGLQKSVADKEARAWEDDQYKQAEAKVKWKQGMSEFEKKGFLSEFRSRYKPQKDEKGEAYASDMDGNRVPDPAKPAKFKGLDELLTDNAKAAKLYEIHEKGGQRVNNVRLNVMDTDAGNPAMRQPVRKSHPALGPR